MTSSDQNKDNSSPQDRIEEIKKEEQEDPTAYYSQGDAKDGFNEEAELSKPVAPVEKAQEEMNLLRAVAYLGFGLAALAIVFILFFIRDLDDRVGGVDSAVNSLEEKIAPLKKEVRDSLARVSADIIGIKSKMNDSERRLAVMELKRALVAVQNMATSDSPEMNAKSSQVVASIQSLLGEFGAGEPQTAAPAGNAPAGEVIVQEAPPIELPVVETEEHAPPAEEHAEEPVAEEAAPEPEATPEIEEVAEEASDDEASDEEEGGEDEEDEEDDE
jgi:hypothetical protein